MVFVCVCVLALYVHTSDKKLTSIPHPFLVCCGFQDRRAQYFWFPMLQYRPDMSKKGGELKWIQEQTNHGNHCHSMVSLKSLAIHSNKKRLVSCYQTIQYNTRLYIPLSSLSTNAHGHGYHARSKVIFDIHGTLGRHFLYRSNNRWIAANDDSNPHPSQRLEYTSS